MNEEIKADRGQFNRAYLIGVQFPRMTRSEVEDHLAELESLVRTLGVEVIDREIVKIAKPSPQFLIGTGKAEEIQTRIQAMEIDLVVFDDDLAAPQQHLWESKSKIAVIDRRKVIIDIFAQRAQTREARLQVQLASLEYTLPRLKRAWTHLERQRGGGSFIGGAGEAQIELDRRMVRDKIARLREELTLVRRKRENQRKNRQTNEVPTFSIVGYTNSGKSSLLNKLTEAGVLQEDKLFATLDPTTRRLELPSNQTVLMTDTVGFIRKLPTNLIDAFKSTLEEATDSDVLIHVLDASHPHVMDHFEVTNKVLEDLGVLDKPTIVVLNKADLLDEADTPDVEFRRLADRVVLTSTFTGEGLANLVHEMTSLTSDRLAEIRLRVPTSRFDVVSRVHREGEVLEEKYGAEAVMMLARFPRRLLPSVAEFTVAAS